MTTQKHLVTRNEVRQMGLDVSSTQFGRYEQAELLHPIKVGGKRSARVHYEVDEVEQLLHSPRRVKLSAKDAS
jgi:hypothetical protein